MDEKWMQVAIDQAKLAHDTWQNPKVGAVIVKNGRLLAKGHTQPFGGIHAERDAIQKLTLKQLKGATLYVTLEPCNHYGKQPPCSELIVKSQFKRVIIAETDPHSLVTGKGIHYLQKNGIEVQTGVLATTARKVNPYYHFFFQQGRPWITVKQSVSLDYRVSEARETRTAITNEQVYRRVHQERGNYQGIVIGSTTAIIDDPTLLTTKGGKYPPIRIILDRRGRLLQHPQLQLLTDHQAPTWLFTTNQALKNKFSDRCRVFCLADGSLSMVIRTITDQGLQSLYVEGGPTIHAAFMNQGLVDELVTYVSPKLLGMHGQSGMQVKGPRNFQRVQIDVLDDNVRIAERSRKNV